MAPNPRSKSPTPIRERQDRRTRQHNRIAALTTNDRARFERLREETRLEPLPDKDDDGDDFEDEDEDEAEDEDEDEAGDDSGGGQGQVASESQSQGEEATEQRNKRDTRKVVRWRSAPVIQVYFEWLKEKKRTGEILVQGGKLPGRASPVWNGCVDALKSILPNAELSTVKTYDAFRAYKRRFRHIQWWRVKDQFGVWRWRSGVEYLSDHRILASDEQWREFEGKFGQAVKYVRRSGFHCYYLQEEVFGGIEASGANIQTVDDCIIIDAERDGQTDSEILSTDTGRSRSLTPAARKRARRVTGAPDASDSSAMGSAQKRVKTPSEAQEPCTSQPNPFGMRQDPATKAIEIFTGLVSDLRSSFGPSSEGPNEARMTAFELLRKNFGTVLDNSMLVEASMLFQDEFFAQLFIGWKDNMDAQRLLLEKKNISFSDKTDL